MKKTKRIKTGVKIAYLTLERYENENHLYYSGKLPKIII